MTKRRDLTFIPDNFLLAKVMRVSSSKCEYLITERRDVGIFPMTFRKYSEGG